MNTYKKYCPNVFVAKCEEKHQKGDVIEVVTKYGKKNKHIVHNFVGTIEDGAKHLYSITKADGSDNRDRAQKKVDKLNSWANSAEKRSDEWIEKSLEGRSFLALGEPIKIGHHSEKRHRALIERNRNRMDNAMAEFYKARSYKDRTDYWEKMANKIDLSMPESFEFFKLQLEDAKIHHKFLKENPSERPHTMALSYAKKKVNDLTKKCKTAEKLWK